MQPPSKRPRISESLVQPALPQSHSAAGDMEGLADLPSELLLEIISYFPTISIDDIIANPTTLSIAYRERFAALRALSQTCKELRLVCLPLAWERLEACTMSDGALQFFREVGLTLERKCNGLHGSRHLLPYVRIVTVSLTRFRTDDVLPAFAKCLAKLPNLHTIQIVHAHSQMTTALKNAFEGRSFPGVRTMILPACAHEILRCCPLVEDVTCNESDGSKIVTALCAAKASKLTSLRGVSLTDNSVKRLAKTAINLRSIHFVNNGPVRQLSLFKHLSTIHIILQPSDSHKDLAALENFKHAKNTLLASSFDGTKQIKLIRTANVFGCWEKKRVITKVDTITVSP